MSSSSWLSIPKDADFSLQNIPFGVFSIEGATRLHSPRCATAIGDHVVDLSVLEEAGLFDDIEHLSANVFSRETLNEFVSHPREVWVNVRKRIQDLFRDGSGDDRLKTNVALQKAVLHDICLAKMHLPVQVGDYTDFYASREHATNVGIMFRGKDNALQPNWLHLPVGYHGRASTVFPSGHPLHRPCGQLQKNPNDPKEGSIYGPCRQMDFELEMALVVGGQANEPGVPLSLEEAKRRSFGFCLCNDISARDIQKWEYVPLGPFTAKNSATIISPWIVTTIALEEGGYVSPTSAVEQVDPVPLPYLRDAAYSSYDIHLTVAIQSEAMTQPAVVSTSNFKNLYWNAAQQLTHHSVSGCVMKPGDLLGSGTISGSTPDSYGSMLELSWKGTKDVVLSSEDGQTEVRKFLEDGDTVVMKGWCQKVGHDRIGFGECVSKLLPALTDQPHQASERTQENRARYKDFKLYGYWKSSSTWRVRIALAAKNISYETIPINLFSDDNSKEAFRMISPLGQVPLLEFKDAQSNELVRMSQSIAILEFLDRAFPDRRSLFPRDEIEKARAYEMIEIINAGTQPLQNKVFLARLETLSNNQIQPAELGKEVIEKGLAALDKLVSAYRATATGHSAAGPFCLGSFSPAVVEAFIVPQLYNAKGLGVDLAKVCPELAKIDCLCVVHPWFQKSHPDRQPDAGT